MNTIENAKRILQEKGCTFAACRDDEIITSTRRGVAPLLDLIDRKISLRDWAVADKVIGRAAAYLYVRLGATKIWCGVISLPALDVFRTYGIDITFRETTELILNRTQTGLCPMESSVLGITDPEEAERAIRNKLDELRHAEREEIILCH